jgi:hypothetical protein
VGSGHQARELKHKESGVNGAAGEADLVSEGLRRRGMEAQRLKDLACRAVNIGGYRPLAQPEGLLSGWGRRCFFPHNHPKILKKLFGALY